MNKHKTKKQKKPLILFSGGLDSTYALICALQISSVDLLIVKSTRLPPGQYAEELARNAIIDRIKKDTASGKLRYGIDNIHVVDLNIGFGSMIIGEKFAQLKYWIFSALEVVNPEVHSHVYVGYVSGDGIAPHIHDIKKTWKHLYKVTKIGKVKISFPLLYLSKQDIVNNLRHSVNEDYLRMAWYCEFPNEITVGKGKNKRKEFIACGKCMSCRRMSGIEIPTKSDESSKLIEGG